MKSGESSDSDPVKSFLELNATKCELMCLDILIKDRGAWGKSGAGYSTLKCPNRIEDRRRKIQGDRDECKNDISKCKFDH